MIPHPFRDNVLVRPELSDKEKSLKDAGIDIPAGADSNKNAVVIAVGTGKFDNGILVPTVVAPGDRVVIQGYGWTVVEVDGKPALLGSEDLVLMRLDPEEAVSVKV